MRAALLILLAACTPDPTVTPDVDAGLEPDAYVPGMGGEYWPCFMWDGPTKCAPKCANKTLLGRPTFGAGCEIAEGVFCERENMTGEVKRGGACCVVAGDRVEVVGCL